MFSSVPNRGDNLALSDASQETGKRSNRLCPRLPYFRHRPFKGRRNFLTEFRIGPLPVAASPRSLHRGNGSLHRGGNMDEAWMEFLRR
jgi:hypothetical protein